MANKKNDDDEFIQRLANRIKSLREQKGYSSYERFANAKDLPRAQVGRYEKGQDIRFTSLVKITRALDISLKDFFSEGFE
jgi:transcriptional regulator with XRE-family HTH domain